MGDQRDGEFVDAGIAREGAVREDGKLAIVAAGQTFMHLANVFLDHMEVVQQPFAGRPHIATVGGVRRQALARRVEDAPRAVQTGEQRRTAATFPARYYPLSTGDGQGALPEMIGAQRFATDGAGEELVAAGRGPGAKAAEQGRERQAGDANLEAGQDCASNLHRDGGR